VFYKDKRYFLIISIDSIINKGDKIIALKFDREYTQESVDTSTSQMEKKLNTRITATYR
jgi:hypothetical protein